MNCLVQKASYKKRVYEILVNSRCRNHTVFYNFQNILFMCQVYIPAADSFAVQYGFTTLKEEKQLTVELSDVPRPAAEYLKNIDWKETVRTFTIEESNRKHLILNSEGKRYTFRKF